nr:DNA mismatch repair endonuclease MutL [Ruminococcus sp.]
MPHINVLSKEISELIAAGEVIERPSSVIKELVENSIDSGAKHITVEIKNGGSTYMRVSDDGCGMAFDDVPTAFLRHATSKIITKEDLDNINTLGFRGEALASISAVARVEVMTKQQDETYGTLYCIEGSSEVSHEKSGCPDGTTIIIRDLFYNVPARAKFMKKDVTEANAVSNIMQKITLSHPDVAFKLIRDNRMEFNSAGDGELFSAVYAIYGRDFARDLIKCDYEYEG